MGKKFQMLFWKDLRMMWSGKYVLIALGSLLFYTLFINIGYVNFMSAPMYSVYIYDPGEICPESAEKLIRVSSDGELEEKLSEDGSAIGIDLSSGKPEVILYESTKKADAHRTDYALSLLYGKDGKSAETVGSYYAEQKVRRETTCELLFVELVAVGFLGIASLLFKEKQMGVIRVHGILPLPGRLFILSKLAVFLLSDVCFAVLMVLCNVGISGKGILPAVLVQTGILSVVMALLGFFCAMVFRDFKQFSLAYLVLAVFAMVPVFMTANTPIKMAWTEYWPCYQLYMGLKNAFFGEKLGSILYFTTVFLGIAVLFAITQKAFYKEIAKEG